MTSNDISSMNREELIKTLTSTQQLLITIGENIKEIQDTEIMLSKEQENANAAYRALSPVMHAIHIISIIAFACMGLIYGGLIAAVIFAVLDGIFVRMVLALPDEWFFRTRKIQAQNKYIVDHVEPLNIKLTEVKRSLSEILNDDKTIWAMDILQDKYFDLNAVTCFLNYLIYRRADSYKEAVNLYEEELHRFRMEELQESILENAEKTARITEQNAQTLKNVEASATSAARAAKIGAVINYATYKNIREMRK